MEACVSRMAELLDEGIHDKTLDGRVDTKGLGKMAKPPLSSVAGLAETAIPWDAALRLQTCMGDPQHQQSAFEINRGKVHRPRHRRVSPGISPLAR